MKIPESIKIGGHLYWCKADEKVARDAGQLGGSCGNDLSIAVDSTVPLQNQQSTLLHEILEQINYRYELCLEHSKISILEAVLYQVLQDNPAVVEFITKKE